MVLPDVSTSLLYSSDIFVYMYYLFLCGSCVIPEYVLDMSFVVYVCPKRFLYIYRYVPHDFVYFPQGLYSYIYIYIMYICICAVCLSLSLSLSIYIYIYRERERETEMSFINITCFHRVPLYFYIGIVEFLYIPTYSPYASLHCLYSSYLFLKSSYIVL